MDTLTHHREEPTPLTVPSSASFSAEHGIGSLDGLEAFEREAAIAMNRDTLRQEFSLLMAGDQGKLICALSEAYRDRYTAIGKFLYAININRHGRMHQLEVTLWARAIGRAFRKGEDDAELGELQLNAMSFGALGHDARYEPDAHPSGARLSKREVDYHAPRGGRMVAQLLGDHRFDTQMEAEDNCPVRELPDEPPQTVIEQVRAFTANWTPEQREVAIRSAWHHSNGSGYRRDVPLAAKLARFADKLDMRNRVDMDKVTPDIRETDSTYVHRLVPGSITDMQIAIDKGTRTFNVIYTVDLSIMGGIVKGGYTADEFEKNFQAAYSTAMQRGAEVAQSLFEHDAGEALDPDADWMRVTLRFVGPDGEVVEERVLPYKAMKEGESGHHAHAAPAPGQTA